MLERTIEIKAALDKSMFARASRAVSIRLRLKRILLLGVAGALISLLGLAIADDPEVSTAAGLLRVVIPTFWIALAFTILHIVWIHPYLTIRSLRGIELPMETTWRIREEGVDVATPKAESKLEWGHWVKWMETPEFFVLFQTARVYNIVPKAAFSREEDVTAIRELLQRKFVKTA